MLIDKDTRIDKTFRSMDKTGECWRSIDKWEAIKSEKGGLGRFYIRFDKII
jgi:hypothetical protein